MKIMNMEVRVVEMQLEIPYKIAYESVESAANVFFRVETDTGLYGMGCAAPDEGVTGETVTDVLETIRGTVMPILKHADPLRPVRLLERLKPHLKGKPSVLAAVDMALLDLMGKQAGMPLWKLLGGFRDRIRTSITIGISSEKETVEYAVQYVKQGFKALKIKGGIDVREDIARILRVRERVGSGIELRFDANQGYTEEETRLLFAKTKTAKLELIEQPTPRGNPDLLGRITRSLPIPVMADESIMDLRDVFRLARKGLVDMVNIKLMKVGGITEALHVNSVARSAGLDVMVGCMDEAALSIAAGLHFALARPNVMYADLDGHIGLRGDPSSKTVILRDGVLYPTSAPGLGMGENVF